MAPALDITTSSIDGTATDEVLHLATTTSTKSIARKTSLQTTKKPSAQNDKDIVSSSTPETPETPQNQQFLQASPYPEPTHLLDLETLNQPLQHFARALTALRPTTPSYATTPYPLAFNWTTIVDTFTQSMSETSISTPAEEEPKLDFYVIVFRSRVNDKADRRLLGELDAAAHLEAVQSGGLLKYWFGSPDGEGRNLATCLWRARSDARRGGAGPGHAQAMRAAASMYDEWFVERLRLSVDVAAGTWEFVPWVD